MKKIISILIAAATFMFAVPAQAKFIKFGVKGGLNFSKLDFDANSLNEISDNSTGFFIGPMAEVTLPILGLGVDGALMYSQRGKDDTKQLGVEIPVNLKYTIGLGSSFGVFLTAGPDFFFNFKDIDILQMESKNTQVGINLGAGLKLIKKLQVGVNYQIPVGNSIEIEDMNKVFGGKNKTWQVSLAYIF